MEINHPKTTVVTATLILLVSLWLIAHRLWPSLPQYNPGPVKNLGQTLADETVKAVHDHGRIVAVINKSHQVPAQPDADVWEAFQSELRKHGAISLAATEIVSPDPVDMLPDAGCSRFQLKAILQKYPDADAIVFFFSLPEWELVEPVLPQTVAPKIIVGDRTVIGTKRHYGGYFDHGILAVLVAKGAVNASPQLGETATARESFKTFTTQNYQSLSD